jgi:uncharacterized protein YqeY
MLHTDIKEGIKEAMKARDAVRLDTLRGISTAFTNELVAKGKTPQDMLTDEEALSVMTRLAKQRKDSIAQYRAGGRGTEKEIARAAGSAASVGNTFRWRRESWPQEIEPTSCV